MKVTRSLSILALGLTFLMTAGRVLAQDTRLSADKQAKLEAAVSKFMAAASLPGLSVAVVEKGEFVWSAGFGMADLENSVPATSLTLYRLASISKSLTATGAMQLWEQGKLDLDAPVQKYCPEFPHMLLSLTAPAFIRRTSPARL
ncbi:MAG: serine hydrolase domain-containing protein [Terriglobales bacterium]